MAPAVLELPSGHSVTMTLTIWRASYEKLSRWAVHTRAGNERLRQLLVLGATAVIRHAKPGRASAWLLALLERRPRKLAAVALANKMARIVWAMMTSGEAYRQPKPVAG